MNIEKKQILIVPNKLEHFKTGKCNVCGENTKFYFSDPVLYREQLRCEFCNTNSRYRSIARGVLLALKQILGISEISLAQLPEIGEGKFDVFDTQSPFYSQFLSYPIPDYLKKTKYSNINISTFRADLPLGERIAESISNQNLESLKFSSNSMDLVITSDVMEHVRLDELAHKEIHRVLRPNGIYIFTVPHSSELKETLVRVKVHDDLDISKDEFIMPPEYHGDANSQNKLGALSYRVYGKDLISYLERLGFEVVYLKNDIPENGIMNTELFYCRKII